MELNDRIRYTYLIVPCDKNLERHVHAEHMRIEGRNGGCANINGFRITNGG
jgi:hypothetical protein